MSAFAVDHVHSSGMFEPRTDRFSYDSVEAAKTRYEMCLGMPGTILVKILKKNQITNKFEVLVVGDPEVWNSEKEITLPAVSDRTTTQCLLF